MAHAITQVKRPVIGITGSRYNTDSIYRAWKLAEELGGTPIFLGDHLERTLKDADLAYQLNQHIGAVCDKHKADKQTNIDLALDWARPNIPEISVRDLSKIDGLLVMGNDESDIDTNLYKHHYPKGHPLRGKTHPKTELETQYSAEAAVRADYEEAMIHLAVGIKMPVFGICAGSQRINAALGGTLVQHIPDMVNHGEHSQDPYGILPEMAVHTITIKKGTALFKLAQLIPHVKHDKDGNILLEENTRHHQAVDEPGIGLKINAVVKEFIKMADGKSHWVEIHEGIEADPGGRYEDQYIRGVQWHPEFKASPLGSLLMKSFVDASLQFAEKTERIHRQEDIQDDRNMPLPLHKQGQAVPLDSRPHGWIELARRRAKERAAARQQG